MLRQWISRLRRSVNPTRSPRRRTRTRGGLGYAALACELLEARTLPAIITWTNPAGGSWSTAANWSLNRVPAAGDDVVIPDVGAAGANVTITLSGLSTITSLKTSENVTFATLASLTVSGGNITIDNSASVTLG